jgi:hypothetical protein
LQASYRDLDGAFPSCWDDSVTDAYRVPRTYGWVVGLLVVLGVCLLMAEASCNLVELGTWPDVKEAAVVVLPVASALLQIAAHLASGLVYCSCLP